MFVLEPLPLVKIIPRSLAGEAVVPCANLINGSVTVKFVVSIVVVVPEAEELFSYEGDFEIIDMIIANSSSQIPANMLTTFSLSAASCAYCA